MQATPEPYLPRTFRAAAPLVGKKLYSLRGFFYLRPDETCSATWLLTQLGSRL
jgi:hypothetical protein